MADLSKPGSEGTLPDGFTPWRLVVAYTVHPELLAPLKYGQEHRIVVSVLRKIDNNDPFSGFGTLYQRAEMIANERAARLVCQDPATVRHARILSQGWFRHENTEM